MRFLLVPALALGLVFLAQPLRAASIDAGAERAAAHVETLGGRTLALLTQPRLTKAARDGRLHEILSEGFGIPTICRRVVGESWETSPPAQRRAFCESFRDYLIGYLIGVLEEEQPEAIEVVAAERLDGQDSRVGTSVQHMGLPLGQIDWIVRDGTEGPEIIDIVTDGVSLIGTYRGEFRAFAHRQGIEALTAALDRKAARR